MNNSDSIYFISICYIGNDSTDKFHAGFKLKNSFNTAKYSWASDSLINMTLFSTVNDSTKEVYLSGRKDGKGGKKWVHKLNHLVSVLVIISSKTHYFFSN